MAQPSVHGLAADPVAARHLDDGRAVQDLERALWRCSTTPSSTSTTPDLDLSRTYGAAVSRMYRDRTGVRCKPTRDLSELPSSICLLMRARGELDSMDLREYVLIHVLHSRQPSCSTSVSPACVVG